MPRPTRIRTHHLTPAEGARLLSAWHRRGTVLQSTFCRQHGVSGPTLRRWLRLGDLKPESIPEAATFTPIPIALPAAASGSVLVTIGSATVAIPMAIDADQMGALFAALRRSQGDLC